MKKSLFVLALLVAASIQGPVRSFPGCDATDPPQLTTTQSLPGFQRVTGQYALPRSGTPDSLVVYFHGYGNTSDSWVCHMLDAASHGAVAFALDYRGTGWTEGSNRGWFVREGALDSIRLANWFLQQYPGIGTVISFGISMGGNASGYAVAQNASRPNGSPLFDYWIDVEGVTTLAEEYVLANAVAPANPFAAGAVEDMNEECRRNYADLASCLADLTILTHANDIAFAGLKGAVVVHGHDDGLVPFNQSREMSTALRAARVPVDQYNVARRTGWDDAGSAGTEGGTTLTQNVADPLFAAAGATYSRPLAGHGWEGSDTHIVIKTAFDRLWNMLDGGPAPANREYLADGDLGVVQIV